MTMAVVRESKWQDHPLGHQGIVAGLRKCASMILAGRSHPDVISWVGHQLVAAGKPVGDLARAKALFEAFQNQYAYMHDPRGVERIVGAHLTLGNGTSPPKFPGGDCDDAVVGCGAALEAAGIAVVVVGGAYNKERHISHVYLLVSDGEGGWTYADPSAKGYAFGQARTPTREVVVDVLTGDILCDDTYCSAKLRGKRPPVPPATVGVLHTLNDETGPDDMFVGYYDGVGRLVDGEMGHLAAEPVTGSQLTVADRDYLGDVKGRIQRSLDRLNTCWKQGNTIFHTLGLPDLGSVDNPLFGPSDYNRAVDLKTMLVMSRDAIDDVLANRRTIGLTEGGLLGPDLLISILPSDTMYVGFDLKNRRPELYDMANVAQHVSGTLGFPFVPVAAAVAVCSLAYAGACAVEAWGKAELAKYAAEQAAIKSEYDLIKSGHTDDLVRVQEARRQLKEADAAGTAGGQTKAVGESVNQAANGLVKVMAAVGVGYLVWEGVKGLQALAKPAARR